MTTASPKKRGSGAAPKRSSGQPSPETMDLAYSLADLPSAQHRAGLAGLVMMVQWLERRPGKEQGTCTLAHLDAGGATLRLDQQGLKRLLDAAYGAEHVEVASQTPWKQVEPVRVEERDVLDGKGGTKKKKFHIYRVITPGGAFLCDYEPRGPDGNTPWLKLWRDMLWETLRGIHATRAPFEARAKGEPTSDHADLWTDLTASQDRSVDLPSTYYIGAQAVTADNVRFRDRPRTQFLLHFWPFAAQIYVPNLIKINDGTAEFTGYAVVVPDVADLEAFCEEFFSILKGRDPEIRTFRPRASLIDLPAEGALDLARRLRERIAAREGKRSTVDLVLGLEVFHLKKEGNSVRLLGAYRLDPEAGKLNEYTFLRGLDLWDPLFRRVRLQNLLDDRPWYSGFDRVVETMPYKKLTIGSEKFCHDARVSFETQKKQSEDAMQGDDQQHEPVTLEDVVYSMMQTYVSRKLKSKYDLEYDKMKDDPKKRGAYNEKREKVARDAFLSVRSRNGPAFVDYFASTLCSVAQYLPQERYTLLSSELRKDPDRVRTLTLLALSAASR